jgi:ribosomal protein S18 acetylase RimI-like enzyme
VADASALSLVAGATLLETFHAVVKAADMVAHVANKSSADVFAGWIGDPASAVFYSGADGTEAPLGYAVLTTPEFPIATDASDIELRRIYTLAATHGSGLGGALMQAVLDEARARERKRVLLGVHPENSRARSFYERTGFRVIGERAFIVGTMRFVDPIYALDL